MYVCNVTFSACVLHLVHVSVHVSYIQCTCAKFSVCVLHSVHMSYIQSTDASMTEITGWTVRYYPTGDSSDIMEELRGANDNGYVLTGLSKGTSYTVSVAASNSAGMGPFTEQTKSTSVDRE